MSDKFSMYVLTDTHYLTKKMWEECEHINNREKGDQIAIKSTPEILRSFFKKIIEDKETEYVYPLCQSISSKPPLPRRMMTDFESAIFNGFEVKIPTCHMWYLHKHYETPMELPPKEKRKPGHAVLKIEL